MNHSGPLNEDEFAVRLEQVERSTRGEQEPRTHEFPELNDPEQKQVFDGAARVIGMLHRLRKSQSSISLQIGDETAADEFATPLDDMNVDGAKIGQYESTESVVDPASIPKKLGRFEIKRLLGQGGNGLVFLAYDPQLEREVALKVPRLESLLDNSTRTRFFREAKAAGGLNHANIVPVFEAGQAGHVCYISSAYCEGSSLGRWILDQQHPLSPDVASLWTSELADAIQHAHNRGIIHRDLKPENILIEERDKRQSMSEPFNQAEAAVLRVTDFGLARELRDQAKLTRSGAIVGTPQFAAPEQTDSSKGPVNHLVDIYGLGAILYYMLCKVPPVEGESLFEVIQNVQSRAPISPRKIRPDIPRDLEAICLKCLEKDPRRRYQTASALQSDLIRFNKQMPVVARRPGLIDRTLMWCRRHRAVSTLAAALLFVLAVSSLALAYLLIQSDKLRRSSDANATKAKLSEKKAMTERDRSRSALHAMTSGLSANWLGTQSELTPEQEAFLRETIDYYRDFAGGEIETNQDQFWIARAEHRLGQLFARLGKVDVAEQSIKRSIELLDSIPKKWNRFNVLLELGDALHDYDALLAQKGDPEQASRFAVRAVQALSECAKISSNDVSARKMLAEAHGNLGSRYQQLRRFEEALDAKTKSVEAAEQLVSELPENLELKRSLGIKLMNLGNLLVQLKNERVARDRFEASRRIRETLVETKPESSIYQFDLAFLLHNLAGFEFRTGNLEEAIKLGNQSIDIGRKLTESHPLVERYRRQLASSLGNQSIFFNTQRDFAASQVILREMNALLDRSIHDFPNVPRYRLLYAGGCSSLATALAELGQHDDAIEQHDAAINQLLAMIEDSIEIDSATRIYESALYSRATVLGYVGRHEDAIADWDALLKVTNPDEVNTIWLCRATSLVKIGKIEEALSTVDRVLAETKELPTTQQNYRFFYNSACVHSLVSARVEDSDLSREHAKKAIDLLKQAIDAGLSPIAAVRADPELEPLHSYAEYQALVK